MSILRLSRISCLISNSGLVRLLQHLGASTLDETSHAAAHLAANVLHVDALCHLHAALAMSIPHAKTIVASVIMTDVIVADPGVQTTVTGR